jgi:cyclopropane-fatty-acyl-phospholipid synthase
MTFGLTVRRGLDRLLPSILRNFIRRGNLNLTMPTGSMFKLGDGSGKPITVRLTTTTAVRRILLDPELQLGECYMDGTLLIEEGTILDLLGLLLNQERDKMLPYWARPQWMARYFCRRLRQLNCRSRARKNVAHHYDLDERLYSLLLDSDQQYSCGYFETPEQSLDDAQVAKKRHLAAKLLLRPGNHVLDIGCGWGGLAIYLARFCDAQLTGITLSKEQLRRARQRVSELGLSGKIEFYLRDYRDVEGPMDRIVSVGMFEHVGVSFYDRYFRKCADLLAEDGVMVLSSIGRSEGPNVTSPWIAKYIFPGGYIPALSEVMPSIERAGLLVTDIEILRLHYAETLSAWRTRFFAHAKDLGFVYDERFLRMWEFYLDASEMAFREQAMMVMQIQLTKRQGIAPMTRGYIAHEERRLRKLDGTPQSRLRIAGE